MGYGDATSRSYDELMVSCAATAGKRKDKMKLNLESWVVMNVRHHIHLRHTYISVDNILHEIFHCQMSVEGMTSTI